MHTYVKQKCTINSTIFRFQNSMHYILRETSTIQAIVKNPELTWYQSIHFLLYCVSLFATEIIKDLSTSKNCPKTGRNAGKRGRFSLKLCMPIFSQSAPLQVFLKFYMWNYPKAWSFSSSIETHLYCRQILQKCRCLLIWISPTCNIKIN